MQARDKHRKNSKKVPFSRREKMLADIFTYLMLLLNLVVVILVVLKTVLDNATCAEDAVALAADIQLAADTGAAVYEVEDTLGLILVILPIMSGVLLTFNNAFNPIQKYNALRWASQSCESEIYMYRCRARGYSAVVTTGEWDTADDEDVIEGDRKQASKKFVDKLAKISTQLRTETQMQVRKRRRIFECFPYVCPEPVLVKCSFLYTNGSKRPFWRTELINGLL
jgi:hypothetical protein